MGRKIRMGKILFCDVCGPMEGAVEDEYGRVLCGYHRAQSDIEHLKNEYKKELKSIKEYITRGHGKRIIEIRKEIKEAGRIMDEYRSRRAKTIAGRRHNRTKKLDGRLRKTLACRR
jgi:hypothetical protein